MDDMNRENTSPPLTEHTVSHNVALKNKKRWILFIVIGVVIILVLGALYYAKSFFVVATVNGSPITRYAVISELEKQGGKAMLESLVNQKLIEDELNKQGISVTPEEVDEEIKKIRERVTSYGGTLEQELDLQGMTENDLREQIIIQKRVEKLLKDSTNVSDEEVMAYITVNNITPPEGMTIEVLNDQIREQLRVQKFQQEAQKWTADLTESAEIKYHKEY